MSQGQHLISVSKQHGGTKNDNYNRYEPALWAPLIYFNYFNLSSLLVLSSSSPNLSHSPLSLSSYEDWAEIPQIARLNAYVSQSGLTKHTRLTASIVWKRGGESRSRNFNTYHHGQTSYSEMFSESTESCVGGSINVWDKERVNKRNSALLVAHWVQCVIMPIKLQHN